MCTNKFWGFFGDFEALFKEISTMYVIQSIDHLFIFGFFIRSEVLLSQAINHRMEQVVANMAGGAGHPS